MRLLECNNDGEFSLTKFFDDDSPEYAILSHTWGAEEVTFRDLVNGTGKSKAGYGKIQFCGEQARRNSLQYFWVDTCCIDKSNSIELQEAINSMFRWYQSATRCYVYLSDVSSPTLDTDYKLGELPFELAFRASRWFTRGWTLQELLAPSSVEFFSREALQGTALSQFSIEERLFWAQSRETTRKEDAAYCLLGIFNVHMPLIYGEGRENAFRRITESINWALKGRPLIQSPALFRAEGVVFEGHSGWVNGVAFSPDGKQLASASSDLTVRTWDTVTGQLIQQLEGHREYVSAVAFSPDGKQLASASSDRTVRLWDAVTGEQVKQLEGHSDKVNDVVFCPNGQQMASASDDRTVRLWDTVTGEIQVLGGHSDYVRAVIFSPDGKQLASASYDRTIRLWVTATGKQVQQLEGHNGHVRAVAFSPDGKQLASASCDRTIILWDIMTGKQVQQLQGHSEYVHAVTFSPNGRQLASASSDRTVRLWDAATGEQIRQFNRHSVSVRSVAFSPDGTQLASASGDWTVRLWSAVTG